jgi:phage anti-repressor protein
MIELKNYDGKMYASALSIYEYLDVKKKFAHWIKTALKNSMIIEGIDFVPCKLQSSGGRPVIEYLLTEKSAIRIVLQSRMKKSIELENIIVTAFKEKQTGISLNVDQISALTDIVKAVTLVSNQKLCEGKHYYFYNQPETWWDYRAGILGYSKESLKEKLSELNIAYKSQKQALIHIQPSEIIRTSVIDLLISLGKGVEYALNVANFAKVIAEKNGYDRQIWDDTKPNPLGINKGTIEERKSLKIDKL